MTSTIRILTGDITTFTGDVIVNAANNAGLGGGGVDGAIHRAAGLGLRDACQALPLYPGLTGFGSGMQQTNEVRIPTGGAIPTPAFDLPCKWVIHTAGPLWPEDEGLPAMITPPTRQYKTREWTVGEVARLYLRDCYRRPALIATGMGLKSIAFPAISTGAYGCSQETCAEIALQWAKDYCLLPLDVTFYIYPEPINLALWQEVARDLGVL